MQPSKTSEEAKKPYDGGGRYSGSDEKADIAIVSSANKQAVVEEWERCGLLPFTDIVLTQTEGSKAYGISRLLEAGYERDHVLMIGDAPETIRRPDRTVSATIRFW